MELKPEKYKGIVIRIRKYPTDKWGAVLYEYTHELRTGWSNVPYGGNKGTAIHYAADSIDAAIK